MRQLVSNAALKAASFRASEEARATNELARMRVNIGYAPATVSPGRKRAHIVPAVGGARAPRRALG